MIYLSHLNFTSQFERSVISHSLCILMDSHDYFVDGEDIVLILLIIVKAVIQKYH